MENKIDFVTGGGRRRLRSEICPLWEASFNVHDMNWDAWLLRGSHGEIVIGRGRVRVEPNIANGGVSQSRGGICAM